MRNAAVSDSTLIPSTRSLIRKLAVLEVLFFILVCELVVDQTVNESTTLDAQFRYVISFVEFFTECIAVWIVGRVPSNTNTVHPEEPVALHQAAKSERKLQVHSSPMAHAINVGLSASGSTSPLLITPAERGKAWT